MTLYAGIDLHSNNCFLAIRDQDGKRVFHKKIKNIPGLILSTLEPYKEDIAQVVVESTYNWYWLVDMLMEENYAVKLANPSAIQQYKGLKHVDDKHDAYWLAEMLRIGVLPTGYIYPKEIRPIRDLLRKRSQLVKLRTSIILSLQNIILRNQCIMTEYLQIVLEYLFQATEQVDVQDIRNALQKIPQGESIMPTIAEKLRQEGRQQGMEQGMQQGMQQGEKKGKTTALIKLMSRKFTLTPEEEALIQSLQDQSKLDQALEEVLFAKEKAEVMNIFR